MAELTLTTLTHSSGFLETFRSLLAQFEQQTGVHVILEQLGSWPDFTRVAVSQHTPSVSEIGTTRVSSLAAMNVLRPFSPAEMNQFGRADEFTAVALETCRHTDSTSFFSVPFTGESYIVAYRRDMLRQAGVDESTAFVSHAAIDQTAACLKAAGVDVPVELTLRTNPFSLIHGLASWVWANGGDYCTPDGTQVLIDRPEVKAAITAYLGLLRHLSPQGRQTVQEATDSLFAQGKAAIRIDNLTWSGSRAPDPEINPNLGVAVLPGARFAGGSNLVVWKYPRYEKEVLALTRFLTSHAALVQFMQTEENRLANRLSILNLPEVQNHPLRRVMAESIRTGRTYPSGALWGMIGDRLGTTLTQIGLEYLQNPEKDLAEIVSRYIDLLAHKLNLALTSR